MRLIAPVRWLLFALFLLSVSASSFAQIGISVNFGPPALPVYEQPICPSEGYLWTPGYWAWDGDDYYWVPGTWVEPPQAGFLWTPGYWGWENNAYFFHGGYWGEHVGWYGGISYGYGYFGHGYEGGRWDGGHFFYNREVNNVNVNIIHNTYNTTIINRNENRVSFNGGRGGIDARASAQEEAYSRERHVEPVAAQVQHVQEARNNRELRASVNQGKPPIAATQRPGAFTGGVPAKEAGGHYEPPANRGAAGTAGAVNTNRPPATHAKEIAPYQKPAAPNTGNPKLDTKYAQQQSKMYDQQNKERAKLEQQQEKDHQRVAQQANDAKKQQVEQQHQQQTQQMQQRHTQQQQQMQKQVEQHSAPAQHSEPHSEPHH
jgi:WXXGXW repeat (2 copies)